jgi:hypothetical protein
MAKRNLLEPKTSTKGTSHPGCASQEAKSPSVSLQLSVVSLAFLKQKKGKKMSSFT